MIFSISSTKKIQSITSLTSLVFHYETLAISSQCPVSVLEEQSQCCVFIILLLSLAENLLLFWSMQVYTNWNIGLQFLTISFYMLFFYSVHRCVYRFISCDLVNPFIMTLRLKYRTIQQSRAFLERFIVCLLALGVVKRNTIHELEFDETLP